MQFIFLQFLLLHGEGEGGECATPEDANTGHNTSRIQAQGHREESRQHSSMVFFVLEETLN